MKQRSSIFDAKRLLQVIEKTKKHQKHKVCDFMSEISCAM
jgi:hypothetical protein